MVDAAVYRIEVIINNRETLSRVINALEVLDVEYIIHNDEQEVSHESGYQIEEANLDMIKGLFNEYDWLDLYFNEEYYLQQTTEENLQELQTSFRKLYPPHNELLEPLIKHILYNPESDLRQKTLADELHLNKTYLSTMFTIQTGMRYVDYVSNVKLIRAAWLLKNTNFKINEIALRLYYKDMAYFSKQFKKMFNLTPSEYRIPDQYQFEI